MFNVVITYGSANSFAIKTPVMADRLPEVEQYVVRMLKRAFPASCIVMVHAGDLVYRVYAVDEPIAIVEIKTGGDDG